MFNEGRLETCPRQAGHEVPERMCGQRGGLLAKYGRLILGVIAVATRRWRWIADQPNRCEEIPTWCGEPRVGGGRSPLQRPSVMLPAATKMPPDTPKGPCQSWFRGARGTRGRGRFRSSDNRRETHGRGVGKVRSAPIAVVASCGQAANSSAARHHDGRFGGRRCDAFAARAGMQQVPPD